MDGAQTALATTQEEDVMQSTGSQCKSDNNASTVRPLNSDVDSNDDVDEMTALSAMPEGLPNRSIFQQVSLGQTQAELAAADGRALSADVDIESGLALHFAVLGSSQSGSEDSHSGRKNSIEGLPTGKHTPRGGAGKDHGRSGRTFDDVSKYAESAAKHPLGVIGGLLPNEKRALVNCETFNGARVQLAQSWVLRSCIRRRTAGGIAVDAPIAATGVYRSFQTGNEAFQQCKKIVDTPFPCVFGSIWCCVGQFWPH